MSMGRFVLGSGSAGRRMVLANAGLDFEVMRPAVAEEAIKARFLAGREESGGMEALAQALADAKAVDVSARTPMAVLGADQVLTLDGALFSKPADMAAARAQLLTLRGRAHLLISALAVAREGRVVWRHVDVARMTMRDFSEDFLDAYLEKVGEKALASVGAYQVEGPGIQLFERVEGDFFTIIGLPLLPFLSWLRDAGIVAR